MFCDLRGFSLHADRSADDLFGLLDRVSRALGVMTRQILEHGGVVGDFQGDSVMAFWGWPLPEPDGPRLACETALAIMKEFGAGQKTEVHDAETIRPGEHPLTGFGFGIGMATGKAVAGRIGTNDQVKFTAFGPVVNLAARLESMTKHWQAPILLDEATASAVSESEAKSSLEGRLRPLCVVQPLGMNQQVRLTELLGPVADNAISDEQLVAFATALENFESGDWSAAKADCEELAQIDRVSCVVLEEMRDRENTVPEEWDGVLRMKAK